MRLSRRAVTISAVFILILAAASDMRRVPNRLKSRLRYGLMKAAAPRPSFELRDVTEASGLRNVHRKLEVHPDLSNLAPWLASLGASVAVTDYDEDGWPDVYLTNTAVGSKNRLFRNNRDGTFTDVAERANLADLNKETGSMRAVFFDYDNDGHQDMLLTTYRCASLHHNERNGRYRDVTAGSGIDQCGIAPASNVLDFDNDGDLDIVIGGYYPEFADFLEPARYDFMHAGFRSTENGGRARLYRNDGDGKFEEITRDAGLHCPRWVMAIGVWELRGMGRPDMHFASDYNPNCLYFNQGGGRFVDASAELTDTVSMSNMSSEFADIFNEGRPSIFVSNITKPEYIDYGNVLWKMGPDGRFRDAAGELGVRSCGWAWGAKFGDLDNDSLQDLVVVNGYLSSRTRRSYWPEIGRMARLDPAEIEDSRNWPAMGPASYSGFERSCVFLNHGDRFTDIAELTGMAGDLSDGRGLATIDYLNDGSLSLVIANQGQPAKLYRNIRKAPNHWIGFRLEGTASNRDAFGARVDVRLSDGDVLTRQLHPANGFMAQSDGRLHFGLGPDPAVDEIVVRWPAGGIQHLRGLELDRYHRIKEPGDARRYVKP